MIFTLSSPRTVFRLVAAVVLAATLAGIAAGCSSNGGGTYQGGSDSVPYHRQ